MEHKTQKIISLALAFLLLSGIFAAVPALVGAEGASDLASQIKGFAHGGTGELDAVASGGTVTVTGKVTGAAKTLKLKIDSGTTVVWKAEYSGSPPNYMVHLQGGSGSGGTFEVAQGGSLVAEGDSRAYMIEVNSQAAHVAVSGELRQRHPGAGAAPGCQDCGKIEVGRGFPDAPGSKTAQNHTPGASGSPLPTHRSEASGQAQRLPPRRNP